MKRMIITGVTGLLGSSICTHATSEYDVFGVARNTGVISPKCTLLHLDLESREETVRHLDEARPDVIVHCAAMTDVDRCEANPEAAWKLHVEASRTLAEWAEAHKSSVVHVSTDSVFDGRTGHYSELDSPAPLNEYARTKLAGEEAVRSANPAALIVRTNFYGLGGKGNNLAQWMLSKLESGQQLRGFEDVFFNPLPVGLLTETILELLAGGAAGTFHVGARNACSKYEFARQFADMFGFDTAKVSSISVDEFLFKARRPKDTSLDVGKVSGFLGRKMPTVQEGLIEFKKQLENECRTLPGKKPHVLVEAPVT